MLLDFVHFLSITVHDAAIGQRTQFDEHISVSGRGKWEGNKLTVEFTCVSGNRFKRLMRV